MLHFARLRGHWLWTFNLIAGFLFPATALAFQQGSPALSRESSSGAVVREDIEALAEEHYRLGLAYLGSPHSTEKAVLHLEKAAELARANAEYHFTLAQAYARDFSFANIFRKPFLAAKVRTQLELAVRYNPSSIPYREELINYYIVAPAFFGGSYVEARRQADVMAGYDMYYGLLAHANISAEMGHHERAVAEYRRAISLRPEAAEAYKRYGSYCLNTREYDQAILQFRKYVELTPNVADSHEALANAYVHKRMYEQAIASYLNALRLDKNRVPLMFRIAQLFEFMGLRADAIRYYEGYLSASPSGRLADDARLRMAELRRR